MSRKTSDEIERASNRFLEESLEKVFEQFDLKIRPYGLHDLKERGIDFIIEIVNPNSPDRDLRITEGILLFYIQNKGQLKSVMPLKSTANKGRISFQLEKAITLEYFVLECDQPVIITLCDLEKRDIYWLSTQLETQEHLETISKIRNDVKTKKRQTTKVQIYFDPECCIVKNGLPVRETAERFMGELRLMKNYLVRRHLNAEKKSNAKKKKTVGSSLDVSQPLEQQLLEYMRLQQKELQYYPIHFLIDDYPLQTADVKTKNEYYQFSLQTSNQNILEYFKSLTGSEYERPNLVKRFDATNLTQDQQELLQRLKNNLIYFIENADTRKRIEVKMESAKSCSCLRCTYNQFEISTVLRKLHKKTDDLHMELQRAYYSYKNGLFIEAATILTEALTVAKKQKLKILQFVIEFNLDKLTGFVRNYSYSSANYRKTITSLEARDLGNAAVECSNDTNSFLIDWIKSKNFISDVNEKIREVTVKIQEQYRSSIHGGSSSNNYIETLYNRFVRLQYFIERNYLIYDEFDDYQKLSRIFIEGILTSHAIDKTHSSRLARLNTFMLRTCLTYADANASFSIINRYRIKEIEIDQDSKFDDMCVNLLNQICALQEDPNSSGWNSNYFLRKTCEGLISNCLVFSSYVKINTVTTNTIASALLRFLSFPERKTWIDPKFVRSFLRKKGSDIQWENFKPFMALAISDQRLRSDNLVDVIVAEARKRNIVLDLPAELSSMQLGDRDRSEYYYELLVDLYDIIDEKGQEFISQEINNKLDQNFDGDLFYVAALFDVIQITDNYLVSFIEHSKVDRSTPSSNEFFGSTNLRHSKVGSLINLCFKFAIDLTDKRFDNFRGIDLYYDWLLDLKGFDYRLFNPSWLLEYQTKFYFQAYRNTDQIQRKLTEYLIENRHERLERVYFDLTNY